MKPIVIVHDVGGDGVAWRGALSRWPGDAVAPDLFVEGASGDRTDVVWLLLEQMEAWRDRDPIIVGCGEHSLAAETFALAGWVGGLVLVDGLGGAWTPPQEQVVRQNEWLRAKYQAADFAGYPRVWVEPFARVLRSNVRCPVLIIETSASITSPGDVDQRAQQFSGTAQVVRLDSADPDRVVSVVGEWMGT